MTMSLPGELVDEARREREAAALAPITSNIDRLIKDGMSGIDAVAKGAAEQMAPVAQLFAGGELKLPTLDELTPEWMRPKPVQAAPVQPAQPGFQMGSVTLTDGRQQPQQTMRPGESVGNVEMANGGGIADVSPDEPVSSETVTRAAAAALKKAGLSPEMAPYIAGIAINEGILQPGTIARDNWSVGGVKSEGTAGTVTVPTREVINGQDVMQTASFGAFNSMQEGMDALAAFVRDSPRFGPVVRQAMQTGDYSNLIAGFKAGGYATDPNWVQQVNSIASGLTAPTQGPRPTTPPQAEQTPLAQRQAGGAFNVSDVASRYTGGQYVFGGGRDQNGLGIPGTKDTDCSGFVSAVWRENGVALPAHTDAAYTALQGVGAAQVSAQDAQPGDIVFYMGSGYGGNIAYHMGIYAGPGQILDASSNGGQGVRLRSISHAGGPEDIVILRDPRVNGRPDPRTSAAPPPVQPTGIAESPLAQKIIAQNATPPSPSGASVAAPPPAAAGASPPPAAAPPAPWANETGGGPTMMKDSGTEDFLPGDGGYAPQVQASPDRVAETFDPDQGAREAIPGSVGSQPLPQTNNPMTYGPIEQGPVAEGPPTLGGITYQNGGEPTQNGDWQQMPVRPLEAQQPANEQASASPGSITDHLGNVLLPVLDSAGQIVSYVQQQARQLGRQIAPRGNPVANVAQGLTPGGQTYGQAVAPIMNPRRETNVAPEAFIRDAMDVGQNAPKVPAAIDQKITDIANEARSQFQQAGQAYDDGRMGEAVLNGVMGALNVVGSPWTVAAEGIDTVLPTMEANSALSMGDAITNADMIRDARMIAQAVAKLVRAGVRVTPELVAALRSGAAVEDFLNGAAGAIDRGIEAVAPVARRAGELASDVGAGIGRGLERAGEAFDANAARVAAADARMAEQGSTTTGMAVGPTPGESRRMYHGTAGAFGMPDPGKFDPNGLFGPGYYLTSDPRVASSYAVDKSGQASGVFGVTVDGMRFTEPDYLRETIQVRRNLLAKTEAEAAAMPAPTNWQEEHAVFAIRRRIERSRQNIAELESGLERMEGGVSAGPNIRAVDVPEKLNLFDAEGELDPVMVGRTFLQKLGVRQRRAVAAALDAAEYTPNENLRAIDVYDALAATLGKDGANRVLRRAGYDGIVHTGGSVMPIMDADGNAIEHAVNVIFPESLTKIRNGFSGEVGGGVVGPSPGPRGAGMGTQLATDAGNALMGSMVGAVAPADTPEERLRNTALGAAGFPLLGRGMRRAGGALGSFGPVGSRGAAEAADAGPAPTFYSQLRRTLEEKMPNRASGAQIEGILKGSPVKPDEITWTGLDDFLRQNRGRPVTKAEVMEFLDQNAVTVEELVKGQPLIRWQQQGDALVAAEAPTLRVVQDADGSFRVQHGGRTSPVPFQTVDEAKAAAQDIATDPKVGLIPTPAQTKYGQYTLPGGENYRELLITRPEQGQRRFRYYDQSGRPGGLMDSEEQAQEVVRMAGGRYAPEHVADPNNPTYTSSHWDEPNVLAHVRFNERVAPDGARVLLVEEIQSDWHQAGRKSGYQGQLPPGAVVKQFDPNSGSRNAGRWVVTNEAGTASYGIGDTADEAIAAMHRGEGLTPAPDSSVPDAPFKKTWPELAMKRMIRWAAENGFDRIAWPPGAVHAERFRLSHQVSEISAYKRPNGEYYLSAWKNEGGTHQIAESVPGNKLADYVGADLAKKIVSGQNVGEDGYQRFAGVDLEVGGEGMKGFYDQILPTTAQKLGKKFGARVGQSEIDAGTGLGKDLSITRDEDGYFWFGRGGRREQGPFAERAWAEMGMEDEATRHPSKMQRVHSMDITPAMRESVVKEGQPMFSALPFDPASAAMGGAAGAASEDENGDSGDPLRTLAGVGLGAFGARVTRVKPPIAANAQRVAAEAAAGARNGARLNARLPGRPSNVPRAVQAATKLTDDLAAQRWAEDMLTDAAGSPRLGEMDPARPSTLSLLNAAGIAEGRIDRELTPAVELAAEHGLHHELPQYLDDLHQRDILDDAYETAHRASREAAQEPIDKAKQFGANAGTIQRMEARADAEAEKAGMAALRKAQGGGGDRVYEAIDARIQGLEQRVAASGKQQQLDEAAQMVWDHNRTTVEQLRDAGIVSQEEADALLARYPHGVPTSAITRLTEDVLQPTDINAAFGTTAGERLNPIVASRIFTLQAQRAIQRNTMLAAFGQMVDDAMAAGGLPVPAGGTRRLWGGGKNITFLIDGKRQTISVPDAVADGLESAAQMGVNQDAVRGIWKALNGLEAGALTATRASFIPMNLARDVQDYAIKSGATEGGPQKIPAALMTYFGEAGRAFADLFAANATMRGVVGMGAGAVTGIAQGDPDRPVAEKAVDALKGGVAGTFLLGANRARITGNARRFLDTGGASGAINPGLRASERWYREAMRDGAGIVKTPADLARYVGDWLTDIATLQGIKAVNERTELITKTAAMRRAEARGLPQAEAIMAGRDVTYDPQRAGSVIRSANGLVKFLNAGTQNVAQMGRLWKKNPKAAAATLVTTVGLPFLAIEAWNRRDPETARKYDDVQQSVKDSGFVVMLPQSSSDARGERPNYVVIPTGWATPIIAGLREATHSLPGLEPSAGRVGADPEAGAGWAVASTLMDIAAMFSPIKGDGGSQIASNVVPPVARQAIELGLNRSLYNGAPLVTPASDERATTASRRIAEGANAAGRAVGSDLLQEAKPGHAEYLARQLPSYGDIYSGASDMVAPSAAKQGEDRPVANQPFFGSIANRFVKDQGGANLERAANARLTERVRSVIEAAGMAPSEVLPVPSRYQGATLTRDEQLRWQNRTNQVASEYLADTRNAVGWEDPTARKDIVKKALAKAREDAARDVLNMTKVDVQDRIEREAARKRKTG